MTTSIPEGWTCPRWLSIYSKAELRYLADRQDARNRELRGIITRLRAQLEKDDGT